MEKEIIAFFEKHDLQLNNKTMVVAVSTGADSMALLVAILALQSRYHLKINVAHLNHQKRLQSVEEEKYIIDFCHQHQIECHVEKLKKGNYKNFQNYARQERYAFFKRVMDKVDGDYLILAHHAIDNMETILMRLIRGSNLKGYAGIDEVSNWNNKLLLRPFLGIVKEQLINYLVANNIKYYEDESNESDIYTRNRIRKEIIPALFNEDKNVHLKFQEFSDTLREANLILNEKVDEFLKACTYGKKHLTFKKDDFSKLSEFLQVEVLFTILKKYNLSKANIYEIIKLIFSKKKNIKLVYKSIFTFVKEYENIFIYDEIIVNNKVDIIIEEIKNYKINDTITIIVKKKDSVFVPTDDDLWYNSNMLPVRIRSRKPGDRILLDSGYKKVKDLLIDLKIGILKRDQVLILEKDGEILAVLGIKKSSILKEIKNNDILVKVDFNNG